MGTMAVPLAFVALSQLLSFENAVASHLHRTAVIGGHGLGGDDKGIDSNFVRALMLQAVQ